MTDNDDPRIRRNHRDEWAKLDRRWRRGFDWLDAQIGPTWTLLLIALVVIVGVFLAVAR